MVQVAKIIGTGLATIGLIGAGVGIGVVFGALILGVVMFSALILGVTWNLSLYFKSQFKINSDIMGFILRTPPKPHSYVGSPVLSGVFFHLGENMHKPHPVIESGKGNYLYTTDGREIFDASSGAAVTCLGHANKRVIRAVATQLKTGLPYASSTFWSNVPAEELAKALVLSTNGAMSKAYLSCSGSEAIESGLKASIYYHWIRDRNTKRCLMISRDRSYHGNTIGALSVSGFASRKEPYIPLLMKNVYFVSSCYPYRQRYEGESDGAFVARKAAELEALILKLGAENVSTFIAEPVVGAALGCVPFVPGYLRAMQIVCRKYGVLFMVDEVMCGMGRTGTLHAWQAEPDFRPDIQTMGKGLGAGYQPIGAMMISEDIFKAFSQSGEFVHGQTYEGMPVQAAAALEVLRIIQDNNLVAHVAKLGIYFGERLNYILGDHPNVGDIRGKGFFWGIELVQDKMTKEPFNPQLRVAAMLQKLALSSPYNMTIYQSSGTVDGISGDHIMLAPSFLVTKKEIDYIVDVLSNVIIKTFENIETK